MSILHQGQNPYLFYTDWQISSKQKCVETFSCHLIKKKIISQARVNLQKLCNTTSTRLTVYAIT